MALEAAETFLSQDSVAVVASFTAERYGVPLFEHAQGESVWASQEAFDGWNFDDAVEEGGGLFQGPGVVVVEAAYDFLAQLFWDGGDGRWKHDALPRHLDAAVSRYKCCRNFY